MNLYENEYTFSGKGQERLLPDMRLFRDGANNRIGSACIGRAPISELRNLGLPELDRRLEALTKGNTMVLRDGRCSLTFPVIVEAQRELLQTFVQPVAERLRPQVAQLASRIRAAVPDNPEMVFHLLWSRVIGAVWVKAWKANITGSAPPDSTWVVYPEQRFAVDGVWAVSDRTNHNRGMGEKVDANSVHAALNERFGHPEFPATRVRQRRSLRLNGFAKERASPD